MLFFESPTPYSSKKQKSSVALKALRHRRLYNCLAPVMGARQLHYTLILNHFHATGEFAGGRKTAVERRLDVDQGLDGAYFIEEGAAVEAVDFDDEDEVGDFDVVGLAAGDDFALLEATGDAGGGAAGREDVVKEGDVERVAFRDASRYVGKAEVDLVLAVLLGDVYADEVTFGEWEFALLAEGDHIRDIVA